MQLGGKKKEKAGPRNKYKTALNYKLKVKWIKIQASEVRVKVQYHKAYFKYLEKLDSAPGAWVWYAWFVFPPHERYPESSTPAQEKVVTEDGLNEVL